MRDVSSAKMKWNGPHYLRWSQACAIIISGARPPQNRQQQSGDSVTIIIRWPSRVLQSKFLSLLHRNTSIRKVSSLNNSKRLPTIETTIQWCYIIFYYFTRPSFRSFQLFGYILYKMFLIRRLLINSSIYIYLSMNGILLYSLTL